MLLLFLPVHHNSIAVEEQEAYAATEINASDAGTPSQDTAIVFEEERAQTIKSNAAAGHIPSRDANFGDMVETPAAGAMEEQTDDIGANTLAKADPLVDSAAGIMIDEDERPAANDLAQNSSLLVECDVSLVVQANHKVVDNLALFDCLGNQSAFSESTSSAATNLVETDDDDLLVVLNNLNGNESASTVTTPPRSPDAFNDDMPVAVFAGSPSINENGLVDDEGRFDGTQAGSLDGPLKQDNTQEVDKKAFTDSSVDDGFDANDDMR